jgi:hypothetical protein
VYDKQALIDLVRQKARDMRFGLARQRHGFDRPVKAELFPGIIETALERTQETDAGGESVFLPKLQGSLGIAGGIKSQDQN